MMTDLINTQFSTHDSDVVQFLIIHMVYNYYDVYHGVHYTIYVSLLTWPPGISIRQIQRIRKEIGYSCRRKENSILNIANAIQV